MSSVWGNKIKVSIFGESHGKSIGVVLDGVPSGVLIDFDNILLQMKRRAPGNNEFSTQRKEQDFPIIQSGLLNNRTTGFPICAIIENKSAHSNDYENLKNTPRPGHSDYTAFLKYNGFADMRGGGHFSGRLTAPLVFAGAICSQILEKQGIFINANIIEIAGIKNNESFISDEIKDAINKAMEDGDSVGGIIECTVEGVNNPIGSPIFNSVEANLSSIIFSIPAVKGIEFGAGFNSSKMRGSECNDEFYIKNNKVATKTNNCGGILGGIANGMPIVFRVAFKPTPSIKKEQSTVDLTKNCECKIEINGRHDPCIVPRALPVVEAVCAIAILDLML